MNNQAKSLKIGLDYHGVINKSPEYFREFCKEALANNHRIYILTGGPKQHIIKKLKAEQIEYTAIFAIIDYYLARQQVICSQYGHFYIDKKLWNTSKAVFCYQHKIDIQIDDSGTYGKYFITPYCRYKNQTKQCLLYFKEQKRIIDMLFPQKAIRTLEGYFDESINTVSSASKSATY